jgi:hypothetical protein
MWSSFLRAWPVAAIVPAHRAARLDVLRAVVTE